MIPEDLAEDVIAVVRESLSNIAKHAAANEGGVRHQRQRWRTRLVGVR